MLVVCPELRLCLGAAGDDTLMVAGRATTQWYADAGEGDDSLSIAGAVQRTTVLAGAGADTLQIGSMSLTSVKRAAAMTPSLLQVLRLEHVARRCW